MFLRWHGLRGGNNFAEVLTCERNAIISQWYLSLQVVKTQFLLENDLFAGLPAKFPQVGLNWSFWVSPYIDFAPAESQTQFFKFSRRTEKKEIYHGKLFFPVLLLFFLLLCVNITIKYQSLKLTCIWNVSQRIAWLTPQHSYRHPIPERSPFSTLRRCIATNPT